MVNVIAEIQKRFNLSTLVEFSAGQGGLSRALITTPDAVVEIYLHGAHVTRFEPTGQKPVLWMSAKSLFQADKPIRGGVPICFPWFGPRAEGASSPVHGFARILEWSVESVQRTADGAAITLGLDANEQTKKWWPHEFSARYEIRVGRQLHLNLRVTNRGQEAFSFEEALHSYFTVGDARRIRITGLEGTTYIDKVDALKRKVQTGDVTLEAETDRVYVNTRAACAIEDPVVGRRVAINKAGSDATVVWNPWIAKSKAMADFGDDEWAGMVCVETVNAGENQITLQAGQTREMSAGISCII